MINLKKYKAFIFDMDNTMIASEPFHIRALAASLKQLLNYDFTWDDGQEYIGITSSEMGARILKRLNRSDIKPAEISKLKTQILLDIFKTEIYPGVKEFLSIAHPSWKLIIASNSVPEFIDRVLTDGNIKQYFDNILTCRQVTHTKPDPEIFLKAAADNHLTPDECLVFEDSDAGLTAARAGGFDSILMLNPGNLIPSEMPANQPMATWKQLLNLIQNI